MNKIFINNDIDILYKDIIKEILINGDDVTARGLDFKEILFSHIILTNPRSRIIQNEVRKLSTRFLIGEFIWIMSGSPWLNEIAYYNKNMNNYSDNGITLHGAYGPRLRHWRSSGNEIDQLQNCLDRLKNDIYTRQASILILDPGIDFAEKTKDIPCNNYLQFLYRDNKLHLMCYVRSNDMMLGFPYDIFHWTMLQELFASILGVEVGEYHHIVGSLHIYNKDIEKARNIIEFKTENVPMISMPKVNDLSIIDKLSNKEKEIREKNKFNLSDMDEYWKRLLNILRKN